MFKVISNCINRLSKFIASHTSLWFYVDTAYSRQYGYTRFDKSKLDDITQKNKFQLFEKYELINKKYIPNVYYDNNRMVVISDITHGGFQENNPSIRHINLSSIIRLDNHDYYIIGYSRDVVNMMNDTGNGDYYTCSGLQSININSKKYPFKSIDGILYKKHPNNSLSLIVYPIEKELSVYKMPNNLVITPNSIFNIIINKNSYKASLRMKLKTIIVNDKFNDLIKNDKSNKNGFIKLLKYCAKKNNIRFQYKNKIYQLSNNKKDFNLIELKNNKLIKK